MKTQLPLVIGTLLCSLNTLPGAVVIDNIAAGTQGFSTGVSGPDAGGSGPLFAGAKNNETAFTFTTGPVADTLLSLDVVISVAGNATPIVTTLSTGSGVPGGTNSVTLGSTTPSASSGITTITIAPNGGVPLAANTTYWIHMTVPTGAGYYSVLHSNTPSESFGYDLGTAWGKPNIGNWNEITGGTFARVRMVTAIPEPGAALLSGIGFLLLLRRRR